MNWFLTSKREYETLRNDVLSKIHHVITNEIVPFANSQGIQTLFVLCPMEWEIGEDSVQMTRLFQQLEHEGLNVFDLQRNFLKYADSPEGYYWRVDHHCNSQGYLVWSKAISSALQERGIVPCH